MASELNTKWSEFKSFVDTKLCSIQFIEKVDAYECRAIADGMILSCQVVKDGGDEVIDFENNYKQLGNKTLKSEVITQFEKNDKILKLASLSVEVTEDGTAIGLLKIPGTPNISADPSQDGRWISEGMAWFHPNHQDDRVRVYFSDEDRLIAQAYGGLSDEQMQETIPGYPVIGSYTDDDLPSENQGWYIPFKRDFIEAEAIGGYGFAPAGFYLKLYGVSGNGFEAGKKLYMNIEWGKVG